MDPRRPRPAGALAAKLLAVAAVLAGAAGGRAAATAPVVWVAPVDGGIAALDAAGTLTLHTDDGGATLLQRDVQGDVVSVCGGRVLVVAADGRLTDARTGATGPRVSPHGRPLCLPSGRVLAIRAGASHLDLLDADLVPRASVPFDPLPDAEPVLLGPDLVALLAAPTQRYRHGVMGDEVEAAAVAVLRTDDLREVARFRVAPPAVIEQRRALPFPAAGPLGMLVTVSTPTGGAAFVALAAPAGELVPVASGPPIGVGHRWSNLFAAVGDRAYAVRTPHLGGPVERLTLVEGGLIAVASDVGVTNHVLGSRNLDLALALPEGAAGDGSPGTDLLVAPGRDLRRLELLACDAAGCAVRRSLELPSALASNLALRATPSGPELVAGLRDGRVLRWPLAGLVAGTAARR